MITFIQFLEGVTDNIRQINDELFYKIKNFGQIPYNKPDAKVVLYNSTYDFLECDITNGILKVIDIKSFYSYVCGFINYIQQKYSFITIDVNFLRNINEKGLTSFKDFTQGNKDAANNMWTLKGFLYEELVKSIQIRHSVFLIENQVIKFLVAQYINNLPREDYILVNQIKDINSQVEMFIHNVFDTESCNDKCVIKDIAFKVKEIVYDETREIIGGTSLAGVATNDLFITHRENQDTEDVKKCLYNNISNRCNRLILLALEHLLKECFDENCTIKRGFDGCYIYNNAISDRHTLELKFNSHGCFIKIYNPARHNKVEDGVKISINRYVELHKQHPFMKLIRLVDENNKILHQQV